MDLNSANLVEILVKLNYITKEQVDEIIKEKGPEANVVSELTKKKLLTK